MSKFIDLTGQTFNRWIVIKRVEGRPRDAAWLCRCVCGNEKIVSSYLLRRGYSRSCGCLHKEEMSKAKLMDLTGQVIGKWTVLKRVIVNAKHPHWLCKCNCGVEKVVSGTHLKSGHTKSCGCLGRANAKQDEIGKVYGKLTVIALAVNSGGRGLKWLCRCECSKEKIISGMSLRKNKGTRSCGCLVQEINAIGGVSASHWGGGRYTNSQGYILIHNPKHPNAYKDGHVLEHVFVMSELIGRPLTKKETVHHKNGIKNDNEPSNLELWVSSHPPGQRVVDLVKWAKEILIKYEPIVNKL